MEKVSCRAVFEQVNPTVRKKLQSIGDVCTGGGGASCCGRVEPALEFWVSILIASRELKRTLDDHIPPPEIYWASGLLKCP